MSSYFEREMFGCELRVSVAQFQVDYQTKKLHIVAIILKYRKSFLIILLLYILWVVIWSSIGLMMNRETLVLRLIGD